MNKLFIALFLPFQLMAELVEIDFKVVDYANNPLPNVQIDFYTDGKILAPYIKSPKKHLSLTTDKDGRASDRFHCWDGFVHCYFKKVGYYPISVRDIMYGASYNARTNTTTFATNLQQVAVKMKPIVNPIDMIHHRIGKGDIKYPSANGAWGFDLQVFDWVHPWGSGIVADFIVHYAWVENAELMEAKGYIEFPVSSSGAYVKMMDDCTQFPIEHQVNTNEQFISTFPFSNHTNKKTGKYSAQRILSDHEYLVIRSRVKKDRDGNIIEAFYSHIKGPFMFGKYSVIGDCYFNPNKNDLNLEYVQPQ